MSEIDQVLEAVLEEILLTSSEIEGIVEFILRHWSTVRSSIPTHEMEIELAEEALLEDGPFKVIFGVLVPAGGSPNNGDSFILALEVASHMAAIMTPILMGLGSTLKVLDTDQAVSTYHSSSLKVVYSVSAIRWVLTNPKDTFRLSVPSE